MTATTADTTTPPASDDPSVNPLVPRNEPALMDKHAVDFEGAHYKPGKGLTIASEDGLFKIALRLRAQLRHELRHDDGDLTQTLGFRRARVQFGGNAFGKHNKFKTELAFSPKDLGYDGDTIHRTPILSWYFEFDHLRDLTLKMGQYKIPFSRQRVISSGNLQLVDRSIANGEFNLDRDIGFDIHSKDVGGLGGYLKYMAGVFLGEGRDQWDGGGDFRLHYLARVEINPFGKFDDYSEGDFARGRTPGLSLGGAYSFVDNAQRNRAVTGSVPTDGGTTDYHSISADAMFKWLGWSAQTEFFWRKGERDYGSAQVVDPNDPDMMIPAPEEAARNGFGWMLQSGYLIPRLPLEIAARYSQVRAVGEDAETSLGDKDSMGGGVSYYFARHPLKLQGDYFRQWSDRDSSTGTDLVRVQLQLAF